LSSNNKITKVIWGEIIILRMYNVVKTFKITHNIKCVLKTYEKFYNIKYKTLKVVKLKEIMFS